MTKKTQKPATKKAAKKRATKRVAKLDAPVISPAADIARAYREGYIRARHDAHQETLPPKMHHGRPIAMASATTNRELLTKWSERAMQHYPDPPEKS